MMVPVQNQPQFDVFISYASVDRDGVEKLVARLESDNFNVWYDQKQISRGQVTLGQLADGIAVSAHMIACLSDAYIDREFTKFELDLNQSMDPANIRNRTIPVLVKPLTRPLPNQILAINRGDLTDPARYEAEYRRITMNITRAREAEPEESARINIEGLKKRLELPFKDPDAEPIVALTQIRIAAESLCRFLFRQELKTEPGAAGFSELVERVIGSVKLPVTVLTALKTVENYGNLAVMDEGEEEMTITTDAIRPALLALKNLNSWFLRKYDQKNEPEASSPVQAVEEVGQPEPEPGTPAIAAPPIAPAADTEKPPAPDVYTPPEAKEPYLLAASYLLDVSDAWLLDEKLLVHNRANRQIEMWDGQSCCWRSDEPASLRRAQYGGADQFTAGEFAAATWEGQVYLFQGGRPALTAKLLGTVGDLAFCDRSWVAGTWRTSLALLHADSGQVELLADVREGVGEIAARLQSNWFAILDLSGGIGIYNDGRKVAAVAPLDEPAGLVFLGQHILTLENERLVTVNLRGEIESVENAGDGKPCRLYPSFAPDRAYLAIDQCQYHLVNPAGMRRPFYRFQTPHTLASTCRDPEKVLFLDEDRNLEYYLGRSLKQSWQGVRAAHFSPDGKFLTVVEQGQVHIFEEKA